MHELSIAERILPVVLDAAAAHGAARVTSVTVRAGALQQIVPESLSLAFDAVAAGTAAEGAELRLDVIPARARCRRCEREFEVEDFVFVCPLCGVADVLTVAGTELELRQLEVEPCESMSSTTS